MNFKTKQSYVIIIIMKSKQIMEIKIRLVEAFLRYKMKIHICDIPLLL